MTEQMSTYESPQVRLCLVNKSLRVNSAVQTCEVNLVSFENIKSPGRTIHRIDEHVRSCLRTKDQR
jgi:hypothetical protein